MFGKKNAVQCNEKHKDTLSCGLLFLLWKSIWEKNVRFWISCILLALQELGGTYFGRHQPHIMLFLGELKIITVFHWGGLCGGEMRIQWTKRWCRLEEPYIQSQKQSLLGFTPLLFWNHDNLSFSKLWYLYSMCISCLRWVEKMKTGSIETSKTCFKACI